MSDQPPAKPNNPSQRKPNWRVTARTWHGNLGVLTAFTLGIIALSCPFIAHGDLGIGKVLKKIHYGEFLSKDIRWIWIDSQGLALALLIVSGWLIHRKVVQAAREQAAKDASSPGGSAAIIFTSPAAEAVARQTARGLESAGFRVFACSAEKYPYGRLNQERWLFIVTECDAQQTSVLIDRLSASIPKKPYKELRHAVLGLATEVSPNLLQVLESLGSQSAVEPTYGDSPDQHTEWIRRLAAVLRTAGSPSVSPKLLSTQPA